MMHGKRGRPPQYVSDVLRGSLVLALAALDALVTDTILEHLPCLIREGQLTATIEDWLKVGANRQTVADCFAESSPSKALAHAVEVSVFSKSTYQRPEPPRVQWRLSCLSLSSASVSAA
jgi:hypothetical protein